jgi:hypothetical protein
MDAVDESELIGAPLLGKIDTLGAIDSGKTAYMYKRSRRVKPSVH